MNTRLSVLMLLLSFELLMCGGQDTGTETGSEEIINGVRYVHNNEPLWGDEPKVSLAFMQKIGGMDATDENYIMFNIADAGRDREGNIYILDSGNIRIQKFNSRGEYVKTIGGKGDGPGEFTAPVSFNLDREGRMFVGDRRLYHFIVLDSDGKEINRFRKEPIGPRCRLLPDNKLIMGGYNQSVANKEDVESLVQASYFSLFRIFDHDGNDVRTFGDMDVLENNGTLLSYANAHLETDKTGNIYIAYRYRNSIEKRDPEGNILFAVDPPLNFEETKFRFENGLDTYPNTISMGISVDNKERIWVVKAVELPEEWVKEWEIYKRLSVRKSVAVFEIFDRNGKLLGSIPLPDDLSLMRIFDDRLLIVDTERVSVSEYRIVDK